MDLSTFISHSFKNHLVISTATYSVEIYTPDTNFKNVYRLKVRIVGENDEQTGENVLADPLTTPKTEFKGYVICQTLETVFNHISKHREES